MTTDLLAPLWRTVTWFRVLALVFAAGTVLLRRDELDSLPGAVVGLVLAGLWTGACTLAYGSGWGRRTRFAVADLGATCLVMLTALLSAGWDTLVAGAPVLTSIWAAGPVLALALVRGRAGAVAGTVLVGATLLLLRRGVGAEEAHTIALLLVCGLLLGYMADIIRASTAQITAALAAQGAATERERLYRSIHDGVLQLLSLVQRRAAGAGGDPELAGLAAEQSEALRTLMQTEPLTAAAGGLCDLTAQMRALGGSRVQVVLPAGPVRVPAPTGAEILAAVREALANVAQHAGPAARAWVVLEDRGERLEVVVRDDGVGAPPARLDAAEAAGHYGVSRSIRGRIADLGGRASVRTAPGEGTEWELTVPRPAP